MNHKIDETTEVECVFGQWFVWFRLQNGYWIYTPVAGAVAAFRMARHGRHYKVVTSPRVDD